MPSEKFDTILPEGFDGTFRFTNNTDEEFIGKWGGREYLFPARKTTPMVIYDATPLETQNIRKKFARDLAVREFFKSAKGKALEGQERNSDGTPRFNSIHQAAQYNDSDLTSFIQECLVPLPSAAPMSAPIPKENIEDKLSKDDEGELVTRAVSQKGDLKRKVFKGDK